MKRFKNKSVALFATMMLAIAAAGYIYQQNQAEESLLSELAMANVEALAYEESNEVTCVSDLGDTCMVGSTPVPNYDEKDSWW